MKRLYKPLALLLGCLLILSGCGAPAASGSSAAPAASNPGASAPAPSTLVYGSGDYTAINPALYEHGEINLLLFSGLTAHGQDNQIVPALAESWDYDESSSTYTFHLRDGVKWHDGEPLTSADVKFTLEAIMDPQNASEIASNYEEITSIETPDDRTVKISLTAPNVAMLDYLTIGILPAHLLEGRDLITDPFNQAPVGTGPYKLTAWDMGQSITLEKNPDYFGGQPQIDTIIFKIVPDTKARALQLLSGELDLAQIVPHDKAQFDGNDQFTVYDMKTADYRGILYNFANPLFRDHRELPAVLSYAIDRQPIIDSVLMGYGQIAYSSLQAGPYLNPGIEKYDYNPTKAKEQLEQAGWETGADGIYEKNGIRLAFAINCGEGDQVRIDMAKICAQQLREIGADVTVAVNAQTDWANQEAYLIGWGSPFDPDDHTYKVFGTQKGSNFSAYSNGEVDRLLTEARETDDDAKRKAFYNEFQEVLAADPAYTFIAYVDAIYACDSRLQGITPDTVLGHHGVGIFWNVASWTFEK